MKGSVMKKLSLGFPTQTKTCSATGTSKNTEVLHEASLVILSKKGITKAQIRLRKCLGWSAPFCSHATKSRFLTMKPILCKCITLPISILF